MCYKRYIVPRYTSSDVPKNIWLLSKVILDEKKIVLIFLLKYMKEKLLQESVVYVHILHLKGL